MNKKTKRLFAAMAAVSVLAGMGMVASAAEGETTAVPTTVTVSNPIPTGLRVKGAEGKNTMYSGAPVVAPQKEESNPVMFGGAPKVAPQKEESNPVMFGGAPKVAPQKEESNPVMFGGAPKVAPQEEESNPVMFGGAPKVAPQKEESNPVMFGGAPKNVSINRDNTKEDILLLPSSYSEKYGVYHVVD